MAQGVPSTNPIFPGPIESIRQKSKQQAAMDLSGLIYSQFGATASLASSVAATSLFNETAATSNGSRLLPAGILALGRDLPTQNSAGTMIEGHLWGYISTNGTPNLTITAGLTTNAGVYAPMTTTGVLATVSTAAILNLDIYFSLWCSVYGLVATGIIQAEGFYRYFPTTTTNAIRLMPWTSNAIDTTVGYTIDCVATWGTSDAANLISIRGATIQMLN
jgi:hypothetical protein